MGSASHCFITSPCQARFTAGIHEPHRHKSNIEQTVPLLWKSNLGDKSLFFTAEQTKHVYIVGLLACKCSSDSYFLVARAKLPNKLQKTMDKSMGCLKVCLQFCD